MRKLHVVLVEDDFFQSLPKFIAKCFVRFWMLIDHGIGTFSRFILRLNTKIIPGKVFFLTQESSYCCNPKYISEALHKLNNDKISIFWRVPKDNVGQFPEYVGRSPYNTYKYFKDIFSSEVIVGNSFLYMPIPFKLKKGQKLIMTWHGSMGIKKFGPSDIKDTQRRVKAIQYVGKRSDYILSNSTFINNEFRKTYWPKTPILNYGHPRNDLFFDNYKEKREFLKKVITNQYGLPNDINILMYGPTFRDSQDFSVYNIDYVRLLETVKAKFGGEWAVFLRFHPCMRTLFGSKAEYNYGDKYPIINVTTYPDIQELIAITDIAITDYSSWIYDFVLRKKPGFIYALDVKKYNNERGFCYPLEETPFAITTSNDELISAIETFDNEKYLQKVDKFLERQGCIEDGHASEKVAQLIVDLCDGKNPNDAILN